MRSVKCSFFLFFSVISTHYLMLLTSSLPILLSIKPVWELWNYNWGVRVVARNFYAGVPTADHRGNSCWIYGCSVSPWSTKNLDFLKSCELKTFNLTCQVLWKLSSWQLLYTSESVKLTNRQGCNWRVHANPQGAVAIKDELGGSGE